MVMRSNVTIGGHPLHPMLIAFPIAFYAGTVASLLAYVGTRDLFWYRAAFMANIAALIMAAVALLPGLIDLLSTPAESRARRIGYIHAGLNVITVVLFLIAAIILGRNWGDPDVVSGARLPDAAAPLVLAIIGVVTLLGAGWFGWTLVQTHHLGVLERGEGGEPLTGEGEAYVPPPRVRDKGHIPAQP
jgi:uncharacterized membrane protein